MTHFRFEGSTTPLKKEIEKYVNQGELRNKRGLAYALLTNDLYKIVNEHGNRNLKAYVALLDELPLVCWGSPEIVRAWCESFWINGRTRDDDWL